MVKGKDIEITGYKLNILKNELMEQSRNHLAINTPEMLKISRRIDELVCEMMKRQVS